MIVVLCVFAVLIELWLFLTAPGLKRARADSWRGTAFAHRGLHDGAYYDIFNFLLCQFIIISYKHRF